MMCWPGGAGNGDGSMIGKCTLGCSAEEHDDDEDDDDEEEVGDSELDRARLFVLDEPANESLWLSGGVVFDFVGHSMRRVRNDLVILKHWMSLSEIGVSRTSSVWTCMRETQHT